MITLDISIRQTKRARRLYSFNKLKGSITNGKSMIYGAIGEILVYDYFISKGLNVCFDSTYDYDLMIEGLKVDVKTKKDLCNPKRPLSL